MAIPYKREKEVRLREMFSSDYQLITILPAWSDFQYHDRVGQELDDVLFARCKDLLIDPERYLSTLNSWLYMHLKDLENVYDTMVLNNYDPLSNYDMKEYEGIVNKEGEKTSSAKRFGKEKTTQTVPDMRNSRYTTTFDNAAEGRLEAYNVQEVIDGSAPTLDNHNAQITETEQLADNQSRQGTELTEKYKGGVTISTDIMTATGDRGEERALSRSGNIGTMTSQNMAESEVLLRTKYSFINYFCDLFAKEMTIGVYEL